MCVHGNYVAGGSKHEYNKRSTLLDLGKEDRVPAGREVAVYVEGWTDGWMGVWKLHICRSTL